MESRIKERLTGALILVAALVILVPEIFSGRRAAESSPDVPAAAPASEGPPLRSFTSDTGEPPPPVAQTPVEPAPEPASVPVPAPAPAPKPAPAAPETTRPAPAVQTTQDAPPAQPPARPAAGGAWFVQVGSFSQAENAQRYAQRLRSQGHDVRVLPPAGSKSLSRVRVGPVATREAATQLLGRLEAAGHKGAVVGP